MADAVKSVVSQQMDPTWYEVIIVDNNSKDDTAIVGHDLCAEHPQVRYVTESNVGLSNARNRAIEESRGMYIGYLDDDARAPQTWLQAARETMESRSPEMFGGGFFPFYTSPRPSWFKDKYAANDIGGPARVLESQESLSGGNLFVRRDVVLRLNGFRPDLGMCGDKIGHGEEDDLQFRMNEEMPSSVRYFDPRLNILHWVRPDKMTLKYTILGSFVSGRSAYRAYFSKRQNRSWLLSLGKQALKASLGLILFCVDRFRPRNRRKYPYFGNYVFENGRACITTLGILYEKWFSKKRGK